MKLLPPKENDVESYDFVIQHKAGKENIPGKENILVDALSRSFCMAWSEPNCCWLQQLKNRVHGPYPNSEYSIKDGILFWECRIMQVLQEFHNSKIGGYEGVTKTANRIGTQFHWKNMQQDIRIYINEYIGCQQVWEDIAMDFITYLLPSNGYTTIMVIAVKMHGIQKSIVSDRDKVFSSSFWQHLFKSQGTILAMRSGYHSQSNGQTENLHKALEMYLRCYVYENPILPPKLVRYEHNHKDPISMQEALKTRDQIILQLKANLLKSQNYMKQQADKRRRDIQLEVKDLALVKLQPYRQQSYISKPKEATWEDIEEVKDSYPCSTLRTRLFFMRTIIVRKQSFYTGSASMPTSSVLPQPGSQCIKGQKGEFTPNSRRREDKLFLAIDVACNGGPTSTRPVRKAERQKFLQNRSRLSGDRDVYRHEVKRQSVQRTRSRAPMGTDTLRGIAVSDIIASSSSPFSFLRHCIIISDNINVFLLSFFSLAALHPSAVLFLSWGNAIPHSSFASCLLEKVASFRFLVAFQPKNGPGSSLRSYLLTSGVYIVPLDIGVRLIPTFTDIGPGTN
ncbi:hypothetical protein V8G54_010798 [Vigna mungo]|uniref:Integrase zinc-binding domain-containing protein n=1 Tax=Vigna mungo TaxID=3915 RepID=A0AAQ3NWH9_VIGMU